MRLFVAVKLSPEAKQLVKDTQTIFRKLGVSGNYTSEENMHLTLAFIGDYDDPDKVMEALKEVSFEPFDIKLGKTGRFGDLWWMGVFKSDELGLLAEKVRKALGDRGIPCDPKQFKAHITFLRRAVYKGTEITLKAVVAGFGDKALTYQWQYSTDGENWSDIEGADQEVYTYTVTRSNAKYIYRVSVNPVD